MNWATIADLPQDVRDAYVEACLQVFLDTFNATEGTDEERLAVAHAAAQACAAAADEADDIDEEPVDDEAGHEADCGCAPKGHGRRSTKVLPLEDAAVTDAGEFTGYANVFGIIDDGGDKVLKGAFKGVIPTFLKEGFISWMHDWATPVAMPVGAAEDDHGLKIRALFHGTPRAQEARQITAERLANDLSMGLSIGYEVAEARQTDYGRDITSFKRLFETGLVLVPMNRPSLVTAAKGALGSGHPYAERLALGMARAEALEREIRSLIAHSRSRAELRRKEGRVLSSASRDRLATLKRSLSEVLKDIDELLRSTDPDSGKAAAQAAIARSFATLGGVALD